MLRKTVRRCGMLALVLALAFAGAAPVAADEIGGSRIGVWSSVWDWLADVFDFSPSQEDTTGNTGGLRAIWEHEEEGPGLDPHGNPTTGGSEEGPGLDPHGEPG